MRSPGPLRTLLPPSVAVAERDTATDQGHLYPGERAAIAGANAGRRQEYATVRWCARRAMSDLGLAARPVLAAHPDGPAWANRAPTWPDGVTGSMTHCDGYFAAALGRTGEWAGLGVDAEPHQPLPDGVALVVARPEERVLADRLARLRPQTHWDRLIFSAKESVYKAWYPLTSLWLGFEEVLVEPDPDSDRFTASLLTAGPAIGGVRLDRFAGRWLVSDGLILTAVLVPAART